MPIFEFQGTDAAGKEVRDRVEAADGEEARKLIRSRGYFVTKLQPAAAEAEGSEPSEQFQELENRVLELLRQGRKIQAVKLCRQESGIGLKEAKDFVEAIAAKHADSLPRRSGCAAAMIVRSFFPTVLLNLAVLTAVPAHGDSRDGFHRVKGWEDSGEFRHQREDSPWHRRQPVVGGLGFEVLLGPWPRLLLRGELDVFNRQHNREIFDYVARHDLGEIRTGGPPGLPKRVDGTWTRLTYRFGQADAAGELTVSRLVPAVLCRTKAAEVELFAGQKLGNRRPGDRTAATPAWVAYVGRPSCRVVSTDQPLSLDDMAECWMLFWFGRATYLRGTRIPNVLARLNMPQFIQDGYLRPVDTPVLAVFQHRPLRLERTEDSLRLTFGPEGAGAIALLPWRGARRFPAEQTEAWAASGRFPPFLGAARHWSRWLKAFPWDGEEAYRMEEDGAVSIRYRFRRVELPDDWDTNPTPVAPIPPVVALACGHFSPMQITPWPWRGLGDATRSGPYVVVEEADTVTVTVGGQRGVDRYVDQTLGWPRPEKPREARSAVAPSPANEASGIAPPRADGAALLAELRDEVRRLVEAGDLAPAPNLIGWLEPHFRNSGETVLAVAEALPYLDPPERAEAERFLKQFMARHDPLTAPDLSRETGAARGYAPPDSVEPPRTVDRPVRWEERANNLYAVWLAAEVTGDWAYIKRHTGVIRQLVTAPLAWIDWATCSYFRGREEDRHTARAHRGEDRGGVWAVNGQFARWVAAARIARRLGDRQLEEQARYLLARTMLFRFAHARIVPYAYQEDLARVEREPDWMLQLSTSGGNGGGPGLLWSDHWAGPQDDVRAAIRWDEFGPVLAQSMNHFWQPVMPHFQDLTPECGRFLEGHAYNATRRTVAAVGANAPAWHLTRRPAYLGKEMHVDSPRNACATLLACCYVLHTPADALLARQDIPFVRVGDLYHLRRLVATLRALGGRRWEDVP